jgi:hypothetical protein
MLSATSQPAGTTLTSHWAERAKWKAESTLRKAESGAVNLPVPLVNEEKVNHSGQYVWLHFSLTRPGAFERSLRRTLSGAICLWPILERTFLPFSI